jgi:hypothetical protein
LVRTDKDDRRHLIGTRPAKFPDQFDVILGEFAKTDKDHIIFLFVEMESVLNPLRGSYDFDLNRSQDFLDKGGHHGVIFDDEGAPDGTYPGFRATYVLFARFKIGF